MINVREVLEFALDGLGSVQRQIVELFYEKNWPVPRISAYLNIPEGTIKSHLYRARKRMKEMIESDDLLNARVGELFA
jgi:RNA polymerase sigma-70 factor (ECF subfamily)